MSGAPAWVAPAAFGAWLAGVLLVGDVFPFSRVDVAGAAATRPRIAVLEARVAGRPVELEDFDAFEGLDPAAFRLPAMPAAGEEPVRRAQDWVAAHPARGRDPAEAVAIEVGYRWIAVGEGERVGAGEPPPLANRRLRPGEGGGEERVEPPPPDLLPGGVDPAGESYDLNLPPEAIDAPKAREGGDAPQAQASGDAPKAPASGDTPALSALPEPPADPVDGGWTLLSFGVAWERR